MTPEIIIQKIFNYVKIFSLPKIISDKDLNFELEQQILIRTVKCTSCCNWIRFKRDIDEKYYYTSSRYTGGSRTGKLFFTQTKYVKCPNCKRNRTLSITGPLSQYED